MILLQTALFYPAQGSTNPCLSGALASNLHEGFSQGSTGFAGFAVISWVQKYELRDKKPELYSKLMKINVLSRMYNWN